MRQIASLIAFLVTLSLLAFQVHSEPGTTSLFPTNITYLKATDSQAPSEALASDDWQMLQEASPNFGYNTVPYWFRMAVSSQPEHQILDISYPLLDRVEFFLLESGNVTEHVVVGDTLPFEHRPLNHPTFLIPFSTQADKQYEILLKVETHGSLQVPIRIWAQNELFDAIAMEDQLHSLYYGVLITVIFFNVFIFLALRELTYLLYVLSTFGYLFLLAALRGVTFQILWPENPQLHNLSILLAIPCAMLLTLLFGRSFLRLKSNAPHIDKVVKLFIALNLAAIAGAFVLDYNLSIRLSVALAIPGCLLLTFTGPLLWLRGVPQAMFYTIAWGLLTIGSAITAANKYGWVPTNFVTTYGMEIGSALEAILLTIALAARLYQEREGKMLAREAELNAMAARRKAELRMMDQALHNPTTGLPNRTSFEMVINDLINRESKKRHAVGIIYLTNLQAITKTLGHRNTDRLLELAARRFNSIISGLPGVYPIEVTDQRSFHLASLEPAALGFIINADEISSTPRSIVLALEQLGEPIDYLGMQLPLDPQTGVAIFPDHAQDTNALIRRAYIAQESDEARDRGLAYYQPARDSYSADRLTLVSELRQALRDNELALHLQPKLCLKTHEVVGAEALIRWPGRKVPIPADQLVSIAEQTGLIKPLTRWVLEQSLSLRNQLIERGYPIGISVNISPNNLREPEFPLYVQRLMAAYPRHRGQIILEVTETSMMLDPANSLRALQSLNATGIPLSIDDFGSGYSSLSYIKQLPAKEIKIDRSLIHDLLNESEDRVIVQTTIDMCHSLGYQVVAEGVEDEATLALLKSMGCDMIQGYLLTPPLPIRELLTWLDNRGSGAARQIG
ncbi:EAL domain-containing protein [Marinobacter zhejiangensis]|uniref:Diguanylate cyclase/phosphodiesterase n=1 Tax=Marinobacter zhejiangensis TaxID=488535 RepID=A0A1I4L540_9GAMM|nr:EAL domain-containing protein [Marinobacter zhejiangensis]SFL86148.1 diguanylate cyclase/phosphodiesterase [Marinobacter zhejiangensis]